MKSILTQTQHLATATAPLPPTSRVVRLVLTGPHDALSRDQVLALVQTLPDWPASEYQRNRTLQGVSWVLDWLLTFPGGGWRDRWVAAAGDTDPLGCLPERQQNDHRSPKTVRTTVIQGVRTLIVARVILPDTPTSP